MCTNNTFKAYAPNAQNCLIFNTETQRCELCPTGQGVSQEGKCVDCKTFQADGAICFDHVKTSLTNCTVFFGASACAECAENSVASVLNAPHQIVTRWINRALNDFDHVLVRPRTCDAQLAPSCKVDFCLEAKAAKNGDICCTKCIKGKTGKVRIIDGEEFMESCSMNLEFCDFNARVIPGMDSGVVDRLSCFGCLEQRVLTLRRLQGEMAAECVKPSNSTKECYLSLGGDKCEYCNLFFKLENNACKKIENCQYATSFHQCTVCAEKYAF